MTFPDTPAPGVSRALGFLLDRFCSENPDVSHALAVSGDGIPLAASGGVDPAIRDQLGASTSGLIGLAVGMASFMRAGEVHDIVVNFDSGWVIVQRPSRRLVLTALAGFDAEMGRVHHELVRLGEAAGRVLEPGPRVTA
ncbi:roadblock/LC7 domain-containing protein [Actinoplanes sp. NEAU-A12]|uniref:Roadblock/LC7 domain-containing protein n=1 Tax=Actinoplanes sandaracinus TaxID=3045177 RepID=A0ABT6WM55_9ACTN|nr:roadblock/LC7 domain-containing protein [Actinoplanes sandaracinus]MDI6100815.1 roadblock/LC7 domain-containing protein [Actinoplanes sandaracinus]